MGAGRIIERYPSSRVEMEASFNGEAFRLDPRGMRSRSSVAKALFELSRAVDRHPRPSKLTHEQSRPGSEPQETSLTQLIGQAPKELELKLLVSPGDLRLLLGAELVTRYASDAGSDRQLRSVYYDTPEHSLAKRGISLRVREGGKGFVQTLKSAPAGEKSFSRHEWEKALEDSTPDLTLFPGSAIGSAIAELREKPLLPLFSTAVRRHAIMLSFKGSRLELAFDQGKIDAGGRDQPISEIEIELKKGDGAHLYELALQLLDLSPLRWSIDSKFDRGYALACGALPATSKAPPSPVAANQTVDEAIAAILGACQRHLLANHTAAEDGRDPEGVHQMRVALRQMRAAFSLFGRGLETNEFNPFDREAKWTARKLGACRNWDVFEAETLTKAQLKDQLDNQLLRGAAEPSRDASYADLREALAGRRYNRFQLSLGHWIECHGWLKGLESTDRERLGEPATRFAGAPLDSLRRKARKKGKDFDELSLRKRHRLRVALKKLRYAVDFFRPLYRKRKAKKYAKKLAELQKLLGKDSDTITTGSLLRELADRTPSLPMARAAASLRKWQARDRRAAAANARKTWEQFKDAPSFW